ncbi:MAG: hypothetical protein JKX75_03165 [Gammaproteobacteria bacterium]|nr:hypothetical protein [Gammaproteobacteria bacterium]
MHTIEQGVRQHDKPKSKLLNLLLCLWILCAIAIISTSTLHAAVEENAAFNKNKQHILILYSSERSLQTSITLELAKLLNDSHSNKVISKVSVDAEYNIPISQPNLIIGVGNIGIQVANKRYPAVDKLFIATDPKTFHLPTSPNNNNAVLYMTQPYCKQIHLIQLLNAQWKTISVLTNKSKPVDINALQQCAKNYNMTTYIVQTTGDEQLTSKIKDALNHSDILLALPDNTVYNRNTVKNILLTSYRYRKPVIAFSKNFVRAGALASIYSSPQHIAQSANKITNQFFDDGQQFKNSITYPPTFDVSINIQVFRALNILIPDTKKLKHKLMRLKHDDAEVTQ